MSFTQLRGSERRFLILSYSARGGAGKVGGGRRCPGFRDGE